MLAEHCHSVQAPFGALPYVQVANPVSFSALCKTEILDLEVSEPLGGQGKRILKLAPDPV